MARKVCKHYVRLLCATTAGMGRIWMRMKDVKEKIPNSLPIWKRCAGGCKHLDLKIFYFNYVLDWLENFEKLIKG